MTMVMRYAARWAKQASHATRALSFSLACPNTCYPPWDQALRNLTHAMSTISNSFFNQNVEVPMNLPTKNKKPYLNTKKPMKKEVGEGELEPPANGLLVPELITVAVETLKARATLMNGVHRLSKTFEIKACRYCAAVHVGPVGHQIASCLGAHNGVRHGRHDWICGNIDSILPRMSAFHLSDRLGKVISHDERHKIPKVPAVVELCIQAGVDIPGYPTKRRTKPAIFIDKRAVDFEKDESAFMWKPKAARAQARSLFMDAGLDDLKAPIIGTKETAALGERTLQAWRDMREGATKLMSKYSVFACGYCPQVHVGPRGTKTCDCRAYKHHQRAGHHGWQEASIDDLVPPMYVWHLRDRDGPPLPTELRVFYGAIPAVAEMCLQAGAAVPDEYKAMMRLDVVIPDLSEVEKVA